MAMGGVINVLLLKNHVRGLDFTRASLVWIIFNRSPDFERS